MVGGLVAPPAEQEEEAVAANSQGVIFVLENAKLETAKVGKVRMLSASTAGSVQPGQPETQQLSGVRDMHC